MTIAIVLLSLLHLRFGEWQDISASGSGLVRAKLELLEKKFDRLLDPLDKLNSKS